MKLIIAFLLTTSQLFAQAKGDKAFGEYLAGECVTCHQLSGKMNGIPPIVGYPQEVIIEFMNDYKTKKRPNQVMQNIATKFSDDDIASLALYFSSLQPK